MISFHGFVHSDDQLSTQEHPFTTRVPPAIFVPFRFGSRGSHLRPCPLASPAEDKLSPPIVVFTKVYQTLSLSFEDSAASPPRRNSMASISPSAPTEKSSPNAWLRTSTICRGFEKARSCDALLTTADHGGFLTSRRDHAAYRQKVGNAVLSRRFPRPRQRRPETDSRGQGGFTDLAALNQQIGLTALLQKSFSIGACVPGRRPGGASRISGRFDPAEIGIAFDIGHAMIVHQDQWRKHFDEIKHI